MNKKERKTYHKIIVVAFILALLCGLLIGSDLGKQKTTYSGLTFVGKDRPFAFETPYSLNNKNGRDPVIQPDGSICSKEYYWGPVYCDNTKSLWEENHAGI